MVAIVSSCEQNKQIIQIRPGESFDCFHLPIILPENKVILQEKLGLANSENKPEITENSIVDIKFHHFKTFISFCTKDSLYFYSLASKNFFPQEKNGLTHYLQKGIKEIQWRPFAANSIAVACE